MHNDKMLFSSYTQEKVPKWSKTLAKIIVWFTIIAIFILSITPWRQSSRGEGFVTAYDPNDRVQYINAPVSGRIDKWFVRDGTSVKKGDPIVEVVDNDPRFIERLTMERDASKKKYDAALEASKTALFNYKRQQELFEGGVSSRLEFENAKINYKKLLAEEAEASAELARKEVRLSRQRNQLVTSPRDGTILRVLHGSGSVFVKERDVLAIFVPETATPAVEIYVDGNDLPLIYPGRRVRLQFEGWPAVQFSGWPSVAVGTFGGVVAIVDPSASRNGKFRVVAIPEEGESWPENAFLRQGTRVYGWVLLDTVRLGYELWRKFNGFPPSMDSPPEQMVPNPKGEYSSPNSKVDEEQK